VAVDFEAEGLLDGLTDERERSARLELLRRLHAQGVSIDELRTAVVEQRLVFVPIELALDHRPERYTREEVAERSGVSLEFLRRLWRAMGMADVTPGDRVFSDEDVQAAHRMRQVLESGIGEEALLQVTRVTAQSMARVAAAIGGTFAESLLQPGDTELEAAERFAQAARELLPVTVAQLEYVLKLHQRQQLRQAMLGQVALAEGRLEGSREITVCFADMVGFTRLGERLPASELGAVAGRLGDLAAEVATDPVRLVKLIGDAAMLVSRETRPLLDAVLDLIDAADAQGEDFPQLRAGVAAGEAIGRAGDWYGRPVNVASRVCNQAKAGRALATAEVKDASSDGFRFSRVGRRRLKGVRHPVELYRVRRAEPAR
jgi:adenylate cyclase